MLELLCCIQKCTYLTPSDFCCLCCLRPCCCCCAAGPTGLSYNQIPSPEEAYGPGNISAGAWYAAEAVWNGGLGDLIVEEVDEGCRSVTVAGVSFGGAVAQLLAMRIEVC